MNLRDFPFDRRVFYSLPSKQTKYLLDSDSAHIRYARHILQKVTNLISELLFFQVENLQKSTQFL